MIRNVLVMLILSVAVLGAYGAAVPDQTEPIPQALRDRLLEIARTYEKIGRVDDEFRWAPGLCRMPNPGRVYFSKSKDADTHGQKLYSLFAKDRLAYLRLNGAKEAQTSPVGQILIKESWTCEEMKTPPQPQQLRGQFRQLEQQRPAQQQQQQQQNDLDFLHRGELFSPYAQKDGKWYHASKKAGLYIMLKDDPKTPNTDQGWIYATVSADGKSVTAAGKIASCMNCHEQARHDRLFGAKSD
ncbi:MAG: cytochrome P460 family protein [Gemmataceae bacterium]